ncbi:MAG: hypothetical protein MRY78_13120 [Saprospiraceae bacterium]|nr:hypothetical protein [Saprospiraceae bacterium]
MENLIDQIKPSRLVRQKRRDKRLAKSILEPGKSYGGKYHKKYRKSGRLKRQQYLTHIDSLPYQESIRGEQPTTYTVEKMEPLIHFLESHSGIRWETVFTKLKPELQYLKKKGVDIDWYLGRFVCTNTFYEAGEIILKNYFGQFRTLSNFPWFYVHPENGCLYSNRFEQQKGPFPKKARKKKIGKEDPYTQFPMEKVHIQQAILQQNKVYDLELATGIANDAGMYRIRLLEIENGWYYRIKVQVLKSYSSDIRRGDELFLLDRPASHYWRNTLTSYFDWQLFDTGTFWL